MKLQGALLGLGSLFAVEGCTDIIGLKHGCPEQPAITQGIDAVRQCAKLAATCDPDGEMDVTCKDLSGQKTEVQSCRDVQEDKGATIQQQIDKGNTCSL